MKFTHQSLANVPGILELDQLPDLSALYSPVGHNHDASYASLSHAHGSYSDAGDTLTLLATDVNALSLVLGIGKYNVVIRCGIDPLLGSTRTLSFSWAFSGTGTQGNGSVIRHVVANSGTLTTQNVESAYLGSTQLFAKSQAATVFTEFTFTFDFNVTVAGTLTFKANTGVSDNWKLTKPSITALSI